jgi:hypothetical protein
MSPGMPGLALLALAGSASACAGWQAQGYVPRVVVEREHPDRLRFIRTDSSRTELLRPRIEGDSLAGLVESRPLAVPLDSVAYVELRRTTPTLLYVGLGLGVAGGIVALVAATWE